MARDKEQGGGARNASTATPTKKSPNRLTLIIAVILLILIIAAALIGSLFFFGVISIGGEETPLPTRTPVDITNPISQFNACSRLLESLPNRYCRQVEIESDSTWSNARLTPDELITELMRLNANAIPGAVWISPINPALPITKIIWLPEGNSIDFARAIIDIANTHPLATVRLNGATLNFQQAPPDELPSAFSILDSNFGENVRQYLLAGRNVLEFQFGNEIAHIPTLEPEATADPEAAPPAAPFYALLAQFNVPVTGEFNYTVSDRFFSNTDWQDSPYAGYLPTIANQSLGDAQWIQGADVADESGLVSVEKIFYLSNESANFVLNVDIRAGSQLAISIFDSEGNEREILNPSTGGTTMEEDGFSYQRFEAIPFASGFSAGINRLVISYAPNSSDTHAIRLNMRNSEQESIFVTDATWLRGAYRVEPDIADSTITLTAQIERGTSHLRGYLAIPDIATERSTGNLVLSCLQEIGEIGCSTISIRHENETYSFGSDDAPESITIRQPLRLFSLDVSFQSDDLEGLATARLGLSYVDELGNQIPIGQGSSWYAYRSSQLVDAPPSVWALVEDASFINFDGDNQAGLYSNVYETMIPLPENAVVTTSNLIGSVDDQVLAIYVNDELAYSNTGESTDFQEVHSFALDNALFRAGDNRLVVFVLNRGSLFALAMRLDLNYFTLVTE